MKDGYYWVKSYNDGKYEIAKIAYGYAFFTDGSKQFLKTCAEIGDYIETPDKYKRSGE